MSKDYLEDLKRISPKTANDLSKKIDFVSLLPAASPTKSLSKAATAPTITKQNLSDAIDQYEKAVNETISGQTRRNYIIDIAVVAITLALIALSAIFSNIQGIATTTGVSGVSIIAQVKASADTSKTYNSDATKLRVSVTRLREQLALCNDGDSDCLNGVKDSITKAFDAIGVKTS